MLFKMSKITFLQILGSLRFFAPNEAPPKHANLCQRKLSVPEKRLKNNCEIIFCVVSSAADQLFC